VKEQDTDRRHHVFVVIPFENPNRIQIFNCDSSEIRFPRSNCN